MQEVFLTGFCLILAAAGAGLFLLRRAAAGRRSAERLFESHLETVEPLGGDGAMTAALRRWLLLAGYRNRGAPATFVAATVAAACCGAAAIYLASRLGLVNAVRSNLELLPPAVGDLFIPVAQSRLGSSSSCSRRCLCWRSGGRGGSGWKWSSRTCRSRWNCCPR